jgi:hypothetical protein
MPSSLFVSFRFLSCFRSLGLFDRRRAVRPERVATGDPAQGGVETMPMAESFENE